MATSPRRTRRPTLLAALVLALTAPLALAACDVGDVTEAVSGDEPAGQESGSAKPDDPVAVSLNVKRGAKQVPVDTRLTVRAEHGTLGKVVVSAAEGKLRGTLSKDRTTWTAASLLEPGTAYQVRAAAKGMEGGTAASNLRFRTADLSLDEQTFPSVAPLDGETVGVGMPVVVSFDVPVKDKAAFEKRMTVTSKPAQKGAWHWLSDTEAHWRPQTYWKPGTQVDVDVAVNSVPAGGGVYGQEDRRISFTVGDSHVYKVDAAAHTMKVFDNGRLVRTFKVTTGKEGFTTRSGIKVIMEKHESKRMRSETIGIGEGDSEYYDLDNVQWAMRLTHSGEFIHAAPWSTGSQGLANVSHGCTGMSTADAKWLYDHSRRGDVVEYVGTDRQMTLENGYGDWNLPFQQYAQGSALS